MFFKLVDLGGTRYFAVIVYPALPMVIVALQPCRTEKLIRRDHSALRNKSEQKQRSISRRPGIFGSKRTNHPWPMLCFRAGSVKCPALAPATTLGPLARTLLRIQPARRDRRESARASSRPTAVTGRRSILGRNAGPILVRPACGKIQIREIHVPLVFNAQS